MAGRSDFNNALPRTVKRVLDFNYGLDPHHKAVVRKMFLEAHAVHKAYKNKKRQLENRDSDSGEE